MKTKDSLLVQKLFYEMQLRNYSSRTIDTYCKLLTKIEDFFETSLDGISAEQFKVYLHRRITEEGISVSLINQSISAFKMLQTDVLKREWQEFKVKRPRKEKKLPVVLSLEEVERMIIATSNIKHKAILTLAYSAGLRRQELQQMRISAIDSARMQVRVVQGKGKKDRYTILSAKALDLLRLYYKYYRPSQYLFEPQGHKGRYLAASTLNEIVKQSVTRAKIKKQISFHTLRHCFATHLLEKGVNIRLIQQFMGHTSLKTTSVYLHLVNIHPSSIVSPLDSMNI